LHGFNGSGKTLVANGSAEQSVNIPAQAVETAVLGGVPVGETFEGESWQEIQAARA